MTSSRVLFLTAAQPITPNGFGGGSAVVYSRLELLAHFGAEVHLVLLSTPAERHSFQRFCSVQAHTWAEVSGWLATCNEFPLHHGGQPARDPVRSAIKLLLNPVLVRFPVINEQNLTRLRTLIAQINPDIIWAEHYQAAWLAVHATSEVPIIFGHHDWEFKLALFRHRMKSSLQIEKSKNIKTAARRQVEAYQRKRLDEAIIKRASGVASVSASEAQESKKLGATRVEYLPPGYPPVTLPQNPDTLDRPRIIHLGQMSTIATRIGLEDFLRHVWPELAVLLTRTPELWVIGQLDGADPRMLSTLENIGAVCPGYVENLNTVMRPYDIHIVPWRFNTGVRTRIPLALNYAQALVAMRTTAACLDELRDGENCLLVDDFTEMAQEIRELINNYDLRQRIADEGRKTFLENFTRQGLQPRFNQFLQQFLTKEGM